MTAPVLFTGRTTADTGEPYVKKYSALIELIDDIVAGRSYYDTIEVTTQYSLGDNEAEFRESLRRIKEAELYLKIGRKVYHPIDLRTIQWRKA
jgi:hypothetical protein